MDRKKILILMNGILERQGNPPASSEDVHLREIGFRSLDLSELTLRIEQELGRELEINGRTTRALIRVADVLDFFEACLGRR